MKAAVGGIMHRQNQSSPVDLRGFDDCFAIAELRRRGVISLAMSATFIRVWHD